MAQNPGVDSTKVLNSKILKLKPDTFKIRALIHLGDYIMKKPGENKQQLDSGMIFFNQAIALAKQLHVKKLEIDASMLAGLNLYQNRDTVGGTAIYKQMAAYYQHGGSVKEKADFWFSYGEVLLNNSTDNARCLICFNNAYRLFINLKLKVQEMNTAFKIATVYSKLGKIDEAITEFLRVEKGFRNTENLTDLSNCQRELADLYWQKGNIQRTIYYNLETLKTAKKLKSEEQIFFANTKLAFLFYNLKMYDKSLPYMQVVYQFVWKTRDPTNFHTLLLSLVQVRIKLNLTKGIIELIKTATKWYPPKSNLQQTAVYEAYGFAYESIGNKKLAEKNFLTNMAMFKDGQKAHLYTGSLNIFTRAYNKAIGDFYLRNKEFKLAKPYYLTILQLPKGLNTPNAEIEVHSALFKIDSAAGDYLSAIRHFQVKTQMHDSLFNANAVKNIADINAKYETVKRLKDIKLLKSQRDAQQLLSQKVILQRNITFGGIAGLLVIAGLSYAGFRNKKTANKRLQGQQAQINQQNYALQILLSDKEVLLTEKDWLLKEVHHRVKNNLQIIMSLLNSQSVFTEDPAALEAIKISRNRVQAISLIHKKLSNEHNLGTVNIKSYVAELVDDLSDGFGTAKQQIIFKQFIAPIEINIAQAVSIALILNEAITNSIKYAFDGHGGEITLIIEPEADDIILLKITDNGKGFGAAHDPFHTPSLGFNIIKGLTAQLKGDFTLEDTSGIRISIRFRLKTPLPAQA